MRGKICGAISTIVSVAPSARIEFRIVNEMKPAPTAGSGSVGKNLTKREREILALVAEGLSNREIADRLVLSPETVKSHVAAILEKLNVSDRTQAAIYAVRNGLVETPTS